MPSLAILMLLGCPAWVRPVADPLRGFMGWHSLPSCGYLRPSVLHLRTLILSSDSFLIEGLALAKFVRLIHKSKHQFAN